MHFKLVTLLKMSRLHKNQIHEFCYNLKCFHLCYVHYKKNLHWNTIPLSIRYCLQFTRHWRLQNTNLPFYHLFCAVVKNGLLFWTKIKNNKCLKAKWWGKHLNLRAIKQAKNEVTLHRFVFIVLAVILYDQDIFELNNV